MKKILAVLVLLGTFSVNAQHREGPQGRHSKMAELSAEQIATLKTKKLTLALALSEKQQEQLFEVHLEEAEFQKEKMETRKAEKEGEKPSTEERFEIESEKLDRRLAVQSKVQSILNDEQFKEWKKISQRKPRHQKKDRHRKGRE